MKETMIKCNNVSFKYRANEEDKEEKYAVDDVSFEVEKGEFLVILGHNGSGKSTIAKHMNAILVPSEGTVIIDGLDTTKEENLWEIRAKAGMVFQNPDNQLVATIVEEDVAFGPENLNLDPVEIRRRVENALDIVGLKNYQKSIGD